MGHRAQFVPLLLAVVTSFTASQVVREPRQLDLGPDTNQITNSKSSEPRQSNFQQPGYLPPIEPAGAQNDPVIVPTTPKNQPTHHGRNLCEDSFHSFLCSPLKPRKPITGAAASEQIRGANSFQEPSKVLAPPLNELDEVLTTRLITTSAPTTFSTTIATTTTRRPTTALRTTTTTTTTTPEPIIGPAASNDNRNYLPPEAIAPAAAQPDLAIVRPDEEHHHRHDDNHPHHHGRDLCSDPFHSFLCAPLKPRKRITGDVPNHLQGQFTFFSPTKVRPDPEVSPQPSNEIERAYIPPSTTPKFIPQASNTVNREYLPPAQPQPSQQSFIRFRPEPSNAISTAYVPSTTTTTTRRPTTTTRRPTTTTRRPTTVTTTTTTTTTTPAPRIEPAPSNELPQAYLPPIEPQPSNEIDRAYLPPVAPQPSNTDSVIVPAAASNDNAILPPEHDHHDHHGSHGFKDICSDPFHSFLCTVPKPRTRITGNVPERLRHLVSPAPSNVAETRVRLVKPTIPPRDISPAPSQDSSVIIPNGGYDYPKPKQPLVKPTIPPKDISPAPSQDSSVRVPNGGYNYPKPKQPLPLPSEREPVFGYSSTLPPPVPSSTGYTYRKPPVELTLPSRTNTILIPSSTVYVSPSTRATTIATTQRPTTGYFYEPPEKKLTLPSDVKQVGYDYPKPKKEFPPPPSGYSYPKPAFKLSLPSDISNQAAQPTVTPVSLLQNEVKKSPPSINALPASIQEAKKLLKTKTISGISNQSSNSDFIPVNQVEFPSDGELGVRFGQRLNRRVRGRRLVR